MKLTDPVQTANKPIKPANIYFTVPQLSKRHAAFSNGCLRWIIYNAKTNGLEDSGALIRIGRKIIIDEALFLRWVKAQAQNGVLA
ncbi:MAG: hypothetical protein WCP01_16950 [Methylococcaceae bacterium]